MTIKVPFIRYHCSEQALWYVHCEPGGQWITVALF